MVRTRLAKPAFVLGLISLAALLAISVMATSWEDKDWTQWTSQDCYHILYSSPWAYEGIVQIVSSIVVRQALVRQAQFDQHYDKMKPDEKQQFDQMATTCLNLMVQEGVIVVRARGLFNPNVSGQTYYLLVSGRKIPALLPAQFDSISPCPFSFVNETDRPHDFVFPRFVDGKPVFQPTDKKFKIGAAVGTYSSELGYQFDIEKMVYKGKPDY
jgi:hypothetical protein